jgi:hypothetical protein
MFRESSKVRVESHFELHRARTLELLGQDYRFVPSPDILWRDKPKNPAPEIPFDTPLSDAIFAARHREPPQ